MREARVREAWVGLWGLGCEARVCEAWVGLWSLGREAWRAVRERCVVKRVLPTERGCMLLVSRITVRLLACWSVAARSAVSGHAPQAIACAHTTQTKDAYERTE